MKRLAGTTTDAQAFCEWLNRPKIFAALDLPPGARRIRPATDAEWERAARGDDGRIFPWGNPEEKEDIESHLSARCNWDKTGIGSTSAAGLFPDGIAACGAADMAGNVWEWCLTKWQPLSDESGQDAYNARKDSDDETGDESRVLRGGSWFGGGPRNFRSTYRNYGGPGARNCNVGFRVVCVLVGSGRG